MVDDRRVMYDGFSDKGSYSAKWFEIVKNFLKLAFSGDRCEVKCLCNKCRNRRMLSEYEKHRFMLNYLVWHQHREVQAPATDESDESNDEDQMDGMIVDIGSEYDLGFGDQRLPLEVQNFYRLLAVSDEKVHDGTDLTVM
jgi:hypothetical protein